MRLERFPRLAVEWKESILKKTGPERSQMFTMVKDEGIEILHINE